MQTFNNTYCEGHWKLKEERKICFIIIEMNDNATTFHFAYPQRILKCIKHDFEKKTNNVYKLSGDVALSIISHEQTQ